MSPQANRNPGNCTFLPILRQRLCPYQLVGSISAGASFTVPSAMRSPSPWSHARGTMKAIMTYFSSAAFMGRAPCTITELLGPSGRNQCCTDCPAQARIATTGVSGTADNPDNLPSLVPPVLHSYAGRWLQKPANSLNTGYCSRVLGCANSRVWGHDLI